MPSDPSQWRERCSRGVTKSQQPANRTGIPGSNVDPGMLSVECRAFRSGSRSGFAHVLGIEDVDSHLNLVVTKVQNAGVVLVQNRDTDDGAIFV